MAKNNRHDGHRIPVRAAALRTSGVPCIEWGLAGIPQTSAGVGDLYSLDVHGVKELALLAGAAHGDIVDIHETTFVLARRARTAGLTAGSRPFAIVVGVPGDDPGPPTGRMFVLLLAQGAAPMSPDLVV